LKSTLISSEIYLILSNANLDQTVMLLEAMVQATIGRKDTTLKALNSWNQLWMSSEKMLKPATVFKDFKFHTHSEAALGQEWALSF
jgi:hypothetical protein